ncbi:hypothetical protein [Candidatus Neptunochlamydia vexilliferae]|uniref:hypothetical protein n=1 Tax=Candidatus Neptunichlamydia vexilliferae TaxID=1651774 RepID=UPI00189178F8|nr:hypothetical protein [Candidatus Neptunochlamydia vexilliferae]
MGAFKKSKPMPDLKFEIPRERLSEDSMLRREKLDHYFPCGLIPFELANGAIWDLIAFTPDQFDYYVDPYLEPTLKNWAHPVHIEELGSYRAFYKNVMVSLFDSWSLYYWSLVLQFLRSKGKEPSGFNLVHIDDHQDLGSPHLIYGDSEKRCLFSKDLFDVEDPKSVAQAIHYKSVGIGTFIVPLIERLETLNIGHLCFSDAFAPQKTCFELHYEEDQLLVSGQHRPAIRFTDVCTDYRYQVSPSVEKIFNCLDSDLPTLLHIDCDGFSNRYNLDSNWSPQTLSIDLTINEAKSLIDKIFKEVSALGTDVFMNICLSPGFFPAEYWEEICSYILIEGEKWGVIKKDGLSDYIATHYSNEMIYEFDRM